MSAHAWMLWPLRRELKKRPPFPTPPLRCRPGRAGAGYSRTKTAARGIYFCPFMLRMPNTAPFDERSIDSPASQTRFPVNKGQKKWLISDLEKHGGTNEITEGTNAKTSVLRGEGEKEVKRSPARMALKIWQFLTHIFCCHVAPFLGLQEGMQIFLSFPYF